MSTLACDLTSRKRPAFLATLAAAYAENGQFAQAVSTVEQADALINPSGQAELAKQCRNMADAFKAGKPWREKMSGPAETVSGTIK
jgi:hypothetical protein